MFSSEITTQNPETAVKQGFGLIANDYHYFIDPAEQFYQTGEYSLQPGVPFAGRMPGYGIFYLLFRFFLSVEGANFMMIRTQAVRGGIGAYALARAAELYFKRFTAFVIVFCIGFLYPVTAFFDYQTGEVC